VAAGAREHVHVQPTFHELALAHADGGWRRAPPAVLAGQVARGCRSRRRTTSPLSRARQRRQVVAHVHTAETERWPCRRVRSGTLAI
jgi:hypothetical protein